MRTFFILALLANLAYLGWRFHTGELFAPVDSRAPTRPTAQQGERLMLVSELPQPAPRVPATPADDPPPAVPSPSPEPPVVATGQSTPSVAEPVVPPGEAGAGACTLVAGFETLEPAVNLVMRLEDAGLVAETRTIEEPVSSTWWVHMPAFATEELARRMLAELQAKDIDSYYMRNGELAGGISLGVFSREESAKAAQEGLARRGYRANIREIPRMAARFQVVAQGSPDAVREVPQARLFLADNPSLNVSEFVCEDVAEANQFP